MPDNGQSGVRFVYDSPSMIIGNSGSARLVAGDIHIGLENEFRKRGIHLYDLAASTARRILSTAEEFDLKKLILLGDIKNEILHIDSSERFAIKSFFDVLSPLDINIVRGNHDAYLSEVVDIPIVEELVIKNFALLHGNTWPSQKAMGSKYLITAHNHAAVSIKDANKHVYLIKAWLISGINPEAASVRYNQFNPGIKMVVMPAYNDMILGSPVNSGWRRPLGPLLSNHIFDTDTASIYSLAGDYLGTVSELSKP